MIAPVRSFGLITKMVKPVGNIMLLLHIFWSSIIIGFVAAENKIVCYFSNRAQYRKAGGAFWPEDIDPSLCTHLVFSHAGLKNGEIVPNQSTDEDTEKEKGMYTRFNKLKEKSPYLKTLLTVGGWSLGTKPFTEMARTRESRKHFIDTSIKYLRDRNFDGIDLHWEFPAARGSPPEDKQRFTALCKEFRAAIATEGRQSNKPPLLLAAAVAADKPTFEKGYEIGEIAKFLDFIGLMSFEFHGGDWEKRTGFNTAFVGRPGEKYPVKYSNVKSAVGLWKKNIESGGQSATKLLLGLASYGRSFHLADANNNDVGSPSTGPGKMGESTGTTGFLSYHEICRMNVPEYWNQQQSAAFKSEGNLWVGYDNQRSMSMKTKYVKSEGLGGVMFWFVDLDDFSGKFCNQGIYPLLSTINKDLRPDGSQSKSGLDYKCKPAKADRFCVGKNDGRYGDEFDCAEFHHCWNGGQHQKMRCQGGLMFDKISRVCTWKSRAVCT